MGRRGRLPWQTVAPAGRPMRATDPANRVGAAGPSGRGRRTSPWEVWAAAPSGNGGECCWVRRAHGGVCLAASHSTDRKGYYAARTGSCGPTIQETVSNTSSLARVLGHEALPPRSSRAPSPQPPSLPLHSHVLHAQRVRSPPLLRRRCGGRCQPCLPPIPPHHPVPAGPRRDVPPVLGRCRRTCRRSCRCSCTVAASGCAPPPPRTRRGGSRCRRRVTPPAGRRQRRSISRCRRVAGALPATAAPTAAIAGGGAPPARGVNCQDHRRAV